ncbi:unnamed protein product [Caenorhabditis auriculariae]|uniref:PPIase cyclophilin-type domain-containing protein n=1 Tax=Caenorhabditis auriculariae TaxID=2777116 RepID=A0A8S1HF23_9PELO|nr:unnamed protein product [Caenorhabditis auriculariae]
MGLSLSILTEATSHYDQEKHAPVSYCKMNQFAYLDVGFDRGVPLGRVVVELDENLGFSLVKIFLQLARGDYVRPSTGQRIGFKNSPLHFISLNGIIMCGDFENGCGGFAPVDEGVWIEKRTNKSKKTKGAVVMLPLDTNPHAFTSIFYICTDIALLETVEDGVVIGHVIEGMDILTDVVEEYGSRSGTPKKRLIIQDSGHI